MSGPSNRSFEHALVDEIAVLQTRLAQAQGALRVAQGQTRSREDDRDMALLSRAATPGVIGIRTQQAIRGQQTLQRERAAREDAAQAAAQPVGSHPGPDVGQALNGAEEVTAEEGEIEATVIVDTPSRLAREAPQRQDGETSSIWSRRRKANIARGITAARGATEEYHLPSIEVGIARQRAADAMQRAQDAMKEAEQAAESAKLAELEEQRELGVPQDHWEDVDWNEPQQPAAQPVPLPRPAPPPPPANPQQGGTAFPQPCAPGYPGPYMPYMPYGCPPGIPPGVPPGIPPGMPWPLGFKEPDRFIFNPLPKPEEYTIWRLGVCSAVIAGCQSSTAARTWIEATESPTQDVTSLSCDPPEFVQVSAKLYAGLLQCLKGPDAKRVATAVKTSVVVGCGRAALHIIDREFSYEGEKLQRCALNKLVGYKVKNGVAGLEEFISDYEDLLYRLRGTDAMPSEHHLCSMLENKLIHQKELEATIANWKCSGARGNRGTHEELWTRIVERVRDLKDLRIGIAAAATDWNPKGKAKGKGKDDKGKGKGKDTKGKGKGKDICDPARGGCGRPGHHARDCRYNPQSKNYAGPDPKANNAAANATKASRQPQPSVPPDGGAVTGASQASSSTQPASHTGSARTTQSENLAMLRDLLAAPAFQRWAQSQSAILCDSGSSMACSYALDSGCSKHTKGTPGDVINQYSADAPWRIQTANGVVMATELAEVQVPQVGKEEFLVIESSPDLLSMGELVRNGFNFEWSGCDFWHPRLYKPSGDSVKLTVVDNVPMVLSDEDEAMMGCVNKILNETVGSIIHCARAAVGQLSTTTDEATELPHHHMLTHLPMSEHCETCQRAKIKRARHDRVPEEGKRAEAFGDNVSTDMVGPTRPSYHGAIMLHTILDDAVDWSEVFGCRDKYAVTTAGNWKVWTAGTPQIKVCRSDGGGEFLKEFDELLTSQGTVHVTSTPNDPQSNSRIERYHDSLNNGIRCLLLQSGLPYACWEDAAVVWVFNRNRFTPISRLDGRTPYEGRFGKPYSGILFPYGCKVIYHDQELASKAKFEPRGSVGCFTGYHVSGAIKIIDLDSLCNHVERGTALKIVVTKNAKVDPHAFPARALGPFDIDISLSEESFGITTCGRCNKARGAEGQELTCPACRGRHRPHDYSSGCKLGRCQCVEAPETPDAEHVCPSAEIVYDGPALEWQEGDAAPAAGLNDDTEAAVAPPSAPEHASGSSTSHGGELGDVSSIGHIASSAVAEALRHRPCSCAVIEEQMGHESTRTLVRDYLGLVTKSISLRSPEASGDAAKLAIKKELNNMTSQGVWRWDEMQELSEVRRSHPNAKFVRLHLLLGLKHSEDPVHAYMKARIIALGNNVRNSRGQLDELSIDSFGVTPLTLEACRVLDLYTCTLQDGLQEMADIECAYLQACLGGDEVFLEFPPELLEDEHKERFTRPVSKCYKAIYGLTRSGFDFGDHFKGLLVEKNWHCENLGTATIFSKQYAAGDPPVKLGPFVDDLKAAGNRRGLSAAWEEIGRLVKLGTVTPIGRFLGVVHKFHRGDDGIGHFTYDQWDYAAELICRFTKEEQVKLVKRHTPGVLITPTEEQRKPGTMKKSASRHLGGLLFLARCTRWDMEFSTNFLARYVHDWQVWNDQMLTQLFSYLWTHPKMLQSSYGSPGDAISLRTWVDSDLAGDVATCRSTSGAVSMACGDFTRFLLSFHSVRQSRTAQSTGEAELVAVNDGLRKQTLVLQGLLMGLDFTLLETEILSDSSAARGAVAKGRSVNLEYMRRSQKLSIAWLKDAIEEASVKLGVVDTSVNISDVMTKHLQQPRLHQLCAMCGLISQNSSLMINLWRETH